MSLASSQNQNLAPVTALGVLLASTFAFLPLFMSIHMTLATLAYFLLVSGVILRKKRKLHVILMNLGVLLDIALVLALQVERNAIQTAMAFSLSPLQQLHILFSTIALVFYFPVLALGWKRYRNPKSGAKTRIWHLRLGLFAIAMRSLGFLLMFTLLGRSS